MLFSTGELLYANGTFANWAGEVLAEMRHPRGTWRTLFLTTDDRVRLVRPDGDLVLRTVLPDGSTVRRVPVEDALEDPCGTVRRHRRGYTVEDSSGAPTGTIAVDGNTYVMSDAQQQAMGSGTERPDAWQIELSPRISDTGARLFLAFVMAMDEALHHPGDFG
ncbi:hypothetical protein [Spirillospora albida]|uniref:hypothetical protein n=1 Tax=Spirillospora albida TaxID=58123 RepID=UPI0004BF04AF|nr:hypothetical protein [Spirillospora albida]